MSRVFVIPVGFFNARLGDVNGCRANPGARKLGDQFIKERLDLFPLGEVRIPFFFFSSMGALLPNAENVI